MSENNPIKATNQNGLCWYSGIDDIKHNEKLIPIANYILKHHGIHDWHQDIGDFDYQMSHAAVCDVLEHHTVYEAYLYQYLAMYGQCRAITMANDKKLLAMIAELSQ